MLPFVEILEERAGWTREDLKALRQRHRTVTDKQNSMANMMGMPRLKVAVSRTIRMI